MCQTIELEDRVIWPMWASVVFDVVQCDVNTLQTIILPK